MAGSICLLLLVTGCKISQEGSRNKLAPSTSFGISIDSLNAATERLHRHVDAGRLANTFVRIVKDGEVVYNDRYGLINMAENRPTEEHSLYRIFSMTKPVTAAAIMTLYDQGKLSLDDKVSMYIPEFAETPVYKKINGRHGTEPQQEEMTIRHLLTHTSGIPYGWQWSYTDSIYMQRQHMRQDWTIGDMSRDLATIPLKFQPGTRYNYGLGVDVAGYIVEVVSGMTLDAYFRTAIFDPLDMIHTSFFVPLEQQNRVSELYTHDQNGRIQVVEDRMMRNVHRSPRLLLGGAGLISTVTDYEHFCRMLLNNGMYNGTRVLSEEAAQLIMTDQLPANVPGLPGKGHGLSGTVDLETGAYSWGGAAATSFTIDPTNNLIILCYTQLIQARTEYASEFKATVYRSLME